ncbi:hypothetical protein [Methylobacterium oxalidis]|uniref:Killer suppression protein HigA n=1 Tax=Methylobacterium oxalidis TaxID=944322 RepID=A0A512IX24_9HYPH|nr:hypothetical protein [Methylobacterium oxalidis]GEP02261.1 hypothetical protein MOX02_02990 [Methylobacterium oxalidis]GLS62206.1 hypothetical protein GCM10007888_05870 [Methylobacterium oxalidis]
MELAFETFELRSICERRRAATAAIGQAAARELEQRLADLVASDDVEMLSTLFPGEILDRTPTERSIRLQAGYDIIFCASHVKTPKLPCGATDWANVSRIRITGIEPVHG